ncbi:MAG: LacI family DNA-binding transcriptional regulator [Anaerolineae bacterium]
MGKVTIADIARLAGVSKTSVSFAFNDPSRLPEETVRRIISVADELGYIPNPVARSLTSKRTGNIGLLFPQPLPVALDNPYMLELLRGVGSVCDLSGYNVLLVSPLLGSMRQAVSDAVVDGFLTIGLEHYRSTVILLEQRRVPYVMVDSEPHTGSVCVNIDDSGGAYEAMRYILELGHRRIAILGIESGRYGRYTEYVGTIRHRMDGYQQALQEAGLAVDGKQVQLIECPCTSEGGYAAFDEMCKAGPLPTAIVTMADVIALGVLEAAEAHQVVIPRDLSLVGYDDLPIARWFAPPLTTVQQPVFEKGQRAAQTLIDLMGGASFTDNIVLPTRLVIRQSAASVAAATR